VVSCLRTRADPRVAFTHSRWVTNSGKVSRSANLKPAPVSCPMTAVVIGYARVSTENQTLDLQRDALTRAGCTRIYEDRMRGAKAARPRGGKGGRPKLLDPEKRRLAVALYNSMQRGIGEICRLIGSRSRRSTAISKRPVPDAPSRIPHEALISVRHRLEGAAGAAPGSPGTDCPHLGALRLVAGDPLSRAAAGTPARQ